MTSTIKNNDNEGSWGTMNSFLDLARKKIKIKIIMAYGLGLGLGLAKRASNKKSNKKNISYGRKNKATHVRSTESIS